MTALSLHFNHIIHVGGFYCCPRNITYYRNFESFAGSVCEKVKACMARVKHRIKQNVVRNSKVKFGHITRQT